jgi:hypothetical protein
VTVVCVAAQAEHHRTRLGVSRVDGPGDPVRALVFPGRQTLAARVEARSRVPAETAVRQPRWLSPPRQLAETPAHYGVPQLFHQWSRRLDHHPGP